MTVGGLILAAGEGRRFGGTKQLADLRGRPLLSYAVEAMLAVPAVAPVVVVLGHAADEIRSAVAFDGAETVVCAGWQEGQSASLRCGIDQLESSYNDYLGAKSNDLLGSTLLDLILNRPKRGASIVTTIDPALQQVAFQELSQAAPHGGAVVALNPSTGEVLAMVSIPEYDPNDLA